MVITPDGRRLRTMVDGPDTDTLVVLEAGLGASALYWEPVQRLLRDEFRVVGYDRAGIGGSAPDPRPRTLDVLAQDLQTVIDAFDHRRVVLCGHSWGGPIIRVAAARRLADGHRDIAGLVLVDQSDEHNDLFFTSGTRRRFAASAKVLTALAQILRFLPLQRLRRARQVTDVRRAMFETTYTPQALRSYAAELETVTDELRCLRDDPIDLGELPIHVLSGVQTPRFGKRLRADLVDAHRRTALRYAGGQFVAATASEHHIQRTEPALVAAQIRRLAAQAG
jgi:pimeloyl-ACP methyl ester carboxylesterase